MNDADVINLALLIARAWLGVMILTHGWNHLRRTVQHQGVAEWFDSLGVRPGAVHAWSVTLTELGVGALLLLGALTPVAYGGLVALMIVAGFTAHRRNGFFIFNPGQGYEYVATVGLLALALGALGPGRWSLDDWLGLSFPFTHDVALVVTAVVGIGGAFAFLATFWRPPR